MEFPAADGGTPNLRLEKDHNFHHVILSGLQGKIPLTIFPTGIVDLHSCHWNHLNGSAALFAHLNLTLIRSKYPAIWERDPSEFPCGAHPEVSFILQGRRPNWRMQRSHLLALHEARNCLSAIGTMTTG